MSFGRILTLNVGDDEFKYDSTGGLRVTFEVARDKTRDANGAVFTIYGLNEETRKALESAGRIFCMLRAGYEDAGEDVIFEGVLLSGTNGQEDSTKMTRLELGDDAEKPAAIPRIRRVFPTGTLVSTVLRELVKATGLKGGNIGPASTVARLAGSTTLTRPYSANGQAVSELQHYCRSLGFTWTLQDQKVVFTGLGTGQLGIGPTFTDEQIEGSVTFDADGNVSFLARLVPEIRPGMPFALEATGAEGEFVALETLHVGDTHGQDWSVEIVGSPAEAWVAKEAKRLSS